MYTYIKCHGRSSPSSPQTLTTHTPRLDPLQGLLEIKDTHRPSTLRYFYAYEHRFEIPLHSFILTLILAHEITGKKARRRSNLLRFLKSRFQLELLSYMTPWISLPFAYTTPGIILLSMFTYIKCHGRSSPSSLQTLTTHKPRP